MAYFMEYKELLGKANVTEHTLGQCKMGAVSTKPTTFLVFTFHEMDWTYFELRCDHPRTTHHWKDIHGQAQTTFSAHPPLINQKDEHGNWRTSGAETYPTKLN